MAQTINTKRLRGSLPEIVERTRRGERFLVLYRSRPAFQVIPVDGADIAADGPAADDALYGAAPVGRSDDGLTSRDSDAILYGKRK